MGRLSWLIEWALHVITCVLVREKEGEIGHTEVEKATQRLGGCGHMPRNVGSH